MINIIHMTSYWGDGGDKKSNGNVLQCFIFLLSKILLT